LLIKYRQGNKFDCYISSHLFALLLLFSGAYSKLG